MEGLIYALAIESNTRVYGKFVCFCTAFAQSNRFCNHIALGMLVIPGTGYQQVGLSTSRDLESKGGIPGVSLSTEC